MDYEHLIVKQEGPVLWVTMNRPERLNALNRRLVDELREFFTGLYWRHEVRAVVLGGAGRGCWNFWRNWTPTNGTAKSRPTRRTASWTSLPSKPWKM
ncbi:MAG TPA: enoyl-CoA hydratase-related protein [Rhizomicrobium sp.]